ncbi:MAG: hypothetical protein ACYDAA_11760 [Syntrophales bacterium]
MAKTKQGDTLSCSACGLVVVVDEVCGCEETLVICCDQPMVKGKPAAGKAGKKKGTMAKAKSAPPKKVAKAAAKKPAAKKSVKTPKM